MLAGSSISLLQITGRGSHLRNLLEGMVRETADRILELRREERDAATVAAPVF